MNLTVASLLAAVLLLAGCASPPPPPSAPVAPLKGPIRMRSDQLRAAARAHPPAPGGIIALGSSHMEKWGTLQADLGGLDVLNHGIGGSKMSQADEHFVAELAIPFRPRAVLLYEGSNDLADGASPEDILAHFRGLHRQLHDALPEARLYVLGIVPSPGKRFERIAELRRTDELLRDECARHPWMTYIDTTTPLLGPDGRPRSECFIPGDIHMTPAGYAVWKAVVAPVLARERR
jgi:lysophospholipase L1-like esterase